MGLLNSLFGKKVAEPARAIDKPRMRLEANTAPFGATKLAFSPDGRFLAAAGTNRTFEKGSFSISLSGGRIMLFSAETFQVIRQLDEGFLPSDIIYSNDGSKILGVIGKSLKAWDAQASKPREIIEEDVELVRFSNDATSALIQKRDDSLMNIDLSSYKKSRAYPKVEGCLCCAGLDQGLAIDSREGSVYAIDVIGGKQVLLGQWNGGEVSTAALSPDRSILAVGSDSGVMALWNIHEETKICENDFSKKRINCFAFAPNSKFVAYGNAEGSLHFMNIAKLDIHVTLTDQVDPILAIAYSPDGKTILTSSHTCKLRVWMAPETSLAEASSASAAASAAASSPAPAVASAAGEPRLDAILVVFNRDFPTKSQFVDEILGQLKTRGQTYRSWMKAHTPVRVRVHEKAQDQMIAGAMALVEFRKLGVTGADLKKVQFGTFEGSEGIVGSVLTHWS